MIDADQQKSLHDHFLSGDPTAFSRIFAEVVEPLARKMTRSNSSLSRELIEDCVMTALWNYYASPGSYDPSRLSLFSFLYMSALGDVRNTLKDAYHSHEDVSDQSVEVLIPARNTQRESDIAASLAEAEVNRMLMQLALEAIPDEKDRDLLRLILAGERDSSEYAAILGIEDLPATERKAEVKRNQDRIKKVLRRLTDKARRISDAQ